MILEGLERHRLLKGCTRLNGSMNCQMCDELTDCLSNRANSREVSASKKLQQAKNLNVLLSLEGNVLQPLLHSPARADIWLRFVM